MPLGKESLAEMRADEAGPSSDDGSHAGLLTLITTAKRKTTGIDDPDFL